MCLFLCVCVSFMINDTWFKFAFGFTPFLTMVYLFMLPVESGLLKFQYKTNLYLTLMSEEMFYTVHQSRERTLQHSSKSKLLLSTTIM